MAVVHDVLDAAGVSIRAGANDGAVLSPAEAEMFADRLIAFASAVRTQSRGVTAKKSGSRAVVIARAAIERLDTMQGIFLGRIRAAVKWEARRQHQVDDLKRKADTLFTRHHFDAVLPDHATQAIREADAARIWARKDVELLLGLIGDDESEALDRLRRLAG